MRVRLAEEQFFCYFSQDARQQPVQCELTERAAYEAQFRSAEHKLYQDAAQEKLNMEAAVGQQFLVLRQELQEAEQEYAQHIRQEARRFAGTRAEFAEELQYHRTAQAQAQSLLTSETERERVHHSNALEEQSTRRHDALNLVTHTKRPRSDTFHIARYL